jgi:hypothetical protein
MRAATFKALVGDRPIDCYLPIDLHNFVNELQYVPLELSREGENTENLRQILATALDDGGVRLYDGRLAAPRWLALCIP